jgi:hypothetical protein
MTVTPSTSGKSTAFITESDSTRTASWVSSDSADAGTYTIKVCGKINTYSPDFRDVCCSYTLTVTVPTCAQS